jgi:serine/threonine protein kinase
MYYLVENGPLKWPTIA